MPVPIPCLWALVAAVLGVRLGATDVARHATSWPLGAAVASLLWLVALRGRAAAAVASGRRGPDASRWLWGAHGPWPRPAGKIELGVVAALVALGATYAWRAATAPILARFAPTTTPCLTQRTQPTHEAPVGYTALLLARVVGPVGHLSGPHGGRVRVRLRLLAVQCGPHRVPLPEAVGSAVLDVGFAPGRGDTLLLPAWVRPLREQVAPWAPKPAALAENLGANVRLRPLGPAVCVRRATGPWARLDRWRVRGARAIERALPPRRASVAKALALGDTAELGPEVRETWAVAGIAHLLAVSGLHVGLVARLGAWPVGRLLAAGWPAGARRGRTRAVAEAFGVAAAWGYAALTGGGLPALRAATMATLAALGQMGGGGGGAANGLGAAGLLLLAWDPSAAQAPSFWLSFVAVAALSLAPPRRADPEACGVGAANARPPPCAPLRHRMAARARAAAACGAARLATLVEDGLAVAVVTAPVTAGFFAQLPAYAPLVNLVAVPLGAALATPLALATLAFAAAGNAAPVRAASFVLERALGHALGALDAVAEGAAALPGARVDVAPLPAWAWLPWTAAALALRRGLGGGQARRLAAWSGAAAATVLGLWAWPLVHRPAPGPLRVWHLDVGHGDATLVQAPHGAFILIDGGGAPYSGARDPGRAAVAQALRALGVRRLAAVVLTHPHPDHYGGLAYVLAHWPTDALWWNQDAQRAAWLVPLAAAARRRGAAVGPPPAHWQWGEVAFASFAPLAAVEASFNDRSVVVRLRYRRACLALLGDVEARGEAAVAGPLGPCAAVKVAHHGSDTSSTPALVDRIGARVATISCGEANRFGFPSAAVVARWRAAGARVFDTGQHGTVALSTQGGGWEVRWAGQGPDMRTWVDE